ncbi:MAG TPA: class I SAM-dependent methyltransferase [Ramlibacter sp.]|jgi:tellurite methyltransferase
MPTDASIRFFDAQFRRQVVEHDYRLNPFEAAALPHLRGRVLDYGCGLGNLALAAARGGCEVVALDASPAAIEHLREAARQESLAIDAQECDLRTYVLREQFDCVVCIGLLMFFDCEAALAQLRSLQDHVRPGGVAVVNVLVEGTTYHAMFDPSGYCLFAPQQLEERFAGWNISACAQDNFPAPGNTMKCFSTVIARKPE